MLLLWNRLSMPSLYKVIEDLLVSKGILQIVLRHRMCIWAVTVFSSMFLLLFEAWDVYLAVNGF